MTWRWSARWSSAFVVALSAAACGDAGEDDSLSMTAEQQQALASAQAFMPMTGTLKDKTPEGIEIRDRMTFDGRQYIWRRKVKFGPEGAPEVGAREVKLEEKSDAEIADGLRALVLVAGHEYIEAEPRWDLVASFRADQAGRATSRPDDSTPGYDPLGLLSKNAEATARDKSIIGGTDNRFTVYNPALIVLDNTDWPSGINGAEGTGHLIGARTGLSAAHVFWDEAAGTWEPNFMWAPGFDSANGTDQSPRGEHNNCYVVSIPSAYKTTQAIDVDYALIAFHPVCATKMIKAPMRTGRATSMAGTG